MVGVTLTVAAGCAAAGEVDGGGVDGPLDVAAALGQVGVKSAVGFVEVAEAQPAAPPASSVVRARKRQLTDRARRLVTLRDLPGAGTSDDVALERPTYMYPSRACNNATTCVSRPLRVIQRDYIGIRWMLLPNVPNSR